MSQLYRGDPPLTRAPSKRLSRTPTAADTDTVKVIYVENCPDCDCAVVRDADGESLSSSRLKAACNGCSCHGNLPIAAGT